MGSRRAYDDESDFRRGDRDRGRRGDRSPRHRFDATPPEEAPFSPAARTVEPAAAQTVVGTVAWYNANKGFGFVTVSGMKDVFLPAAALERAGIDRIDQGATVTCSVRSEGRGPTVDNIVSVDQSTVVSSERAAPVRKSEAVEGSVNGTVKWFDEVRGFGFIAAETGDDIFVHASAVRRSGLEVLLPDQALVVEYGRSERGRVAVSLRLL